MKKLVVPIEFGAGAPVLLETTVDLARALRAEVSLIHVCSPPTPVVAGPMMATPLSEAGASVAEDVAREKLEALASPLERRGLAVKTVVTTGTPASEVLEHAEREAADYLIVGNGRKGVIERALLGSVSHQLVKEAKCPVVVIDTTSETAAAPSHS